MKLTALVLSAATLASLAPAWASECGQQIQAIERRMGSAGAAQVTGDKPNPGSKSQASNEQGHAPAPVNPSQDATPEKMAKAKSLIEKAKQQDKAGDKDGCEKTMMEAQANMGAIP